MADFQVVLAALLSPDNETRNQAEEQFTNLQAAIKVPHLVSAMRTHGASEEVRTIAAVLLRRVFLQMEYKDLSEQIDVGVLHGCRAELLLAVQTEPSAPIRRKICDAIAELARSSIDEEDINHWPEILKFLFDSCDLERYHLYENALHIISVVPGIFGNQLNYCVDVINQMLVRALESQHKEVWSEAFKAATAFIVFLDNNSLRHRFAGLLPLMLAVSGR